MIVPLPPLGNQGRGMKNSFLLCLCLLFLHKIMSNQKKKENQQIKYNKKANSLNLHPFSVIRGKAPPPPSYSPAYMPKRVSILKRAMRTTRRLSTSARHVEIRADGSCTCSVAHVPRKKKQKVISFDSWNGFPLQGLSVGKESNPVTSEKRDDSFQQHFSCALLINTMGWMIFI